MKRKIILVHVLVHYSRYIILFLLHDWTDWALCQCYIDLGWLANRQTNRWIPNREQEFSHSHSLPHPGHQVLGHFVCHGRMAWRSAETYHQDELTWQCAGRIPAHRDIPAGVLANQWKLFRTIMVWIHLNHAFSNKSIHSHIWQTLLYWYAFLLWCHLLYLSNGDVI